MVPPCSTLVPAASFVRSRSTSVPTVVVSSSSSFAGSVSVVSVVTVPVFVKSAITPGFTVVRISKVASSPAASVPIAHVTVRLGTS